MNRSQGYLKNTVLLIIFSLLGCVPAINHSNTDTVAYKGEWESNVINVCWLFQTEQTMEFRANIESSIKDAFKDTIVEFTGWGSCQENDKQFTVQILIYDDEGAYEHPEYKKILSWLLRRSEGRREGIGHPRVVGHPLSRDTKWDYHVVLNQTMLDAHPEAVIQYRESTNQGKWNFTTSASIHEFGHVLGLRHEDAHPDRTCDDYAEELGAAEVISDYNPFSFMSRCYYRTFNYNLGIIKPNQRDIEGINLLFEDLVE